MVRGTLTMTAVPEVTLTPERTPEGQIAGIEENTPIRQAQQFLRVAGIRRSQ
jgi:hypothetical protein